MRALEHSYFQRPTPIGLAHRGGALHPANLRLENSLVAFRTAVSLGFEYLETDAHATADGVLLAVHDRRLDRVSDASGLIADLPYAAVREARIGGTEPIPLLEDLLEEFPTSRFNIDVKAPGAVEPLVRVLRRHGALDRVCLASFSPARLRAVRRALGPGLATAAGPGGATALRFTPWSLSRWLHCDAPVLQLPSRVPVRGRGLPVVTAGLVRRAHALGKHVHVWTIDDPLEMHRLLDLGADGIISDRIDLLAGVLAERGHPLTPPAT